MKPVTQIKNQWLLKRSTAASQLAILCAVVVSAALAQPADARPHSKRHPVAIKHHNARPVAVKKRYATATPEPKIDAALAANVAEPAPPVVPLKLLSRDEILNSDPGRLERIGRHVIGG